ALPTSDAQIQFIIDRLERLSAQPSPTKASTGEYSGLSILVYVHGWKHNAEVDDDDVETFRKTLRTLSIVEQARANVNTRKLGRPTLPRRTVGIYVGWRGTSLLWYLKHLTFYDRMTVARNVAIGQSRHLFMLLKGFQARENSKDSDAERRERTCPSGKAEEC